VLTDLDDTLESRPADEPVGESLTMVLRHCLESFVDDPRNTALRQIIDEAPALRTRLFDISTESFKAFESALAKRMAVPPDDVSAMMTARMAFQVFEIVADRWWCGDHSESRTDILNDVLTTLAEHDVVLPTPLDRVSRDSRP
jgi:hypothetical protein